MLEAALGHSRVSRSINTAFIERYNGTDRNRNARKVRKTYCLSKDREVHESMTYFTLYSYNFCWPVRTLGEPAAAEPGDGGGASRSCLVAGGMGIVSGHSTRVGHQGKIGSVYRAAKERSVSLRPVLGLPACYSAVSAR